LFGKVCPDIVSSCEEAIRTSAKNGNQDDIIVIGERAGSSISVTYKRLSFSPSLLEYSLELGVALHPGSLVAGRG
jgi:phosphosulfolactate phosphohydrolase-like enzyme